VPVAQWRLRCFLLPTSCHEAHQAQASQHHRISLGFGNRRHHRLASIAQLGTRLVEIVGRLAGIETSDRGAGGRVNRDEEVSVYSYWGARIGEGNVGDRRAVGCPLERGIRPQKGRARRDKCGQNHATETREAPEVVDRNKVAADELLCIATDGGGEFQRVVEVEAICNALEVGD